MVCFVMKIGCSVRFWPSEWINAGEENCLRSSITTTTAVGLVQGNRTLPAASICRAESQLGGLARQHARLPLQTPACFPGRTVPSNNF